MRVISWRLLSLGIAVLSLALVNNPAFAQRGGGGGHGGGGGKGGGGGESAWHGSGGGSGGKASGGGGEREWSGSGNFRGSGGMDYGSYRSGGTRDRNWSGDNYSRNYSGDSWRRGDNWRGDGDWRGGNWDRGYHSYYGGGWGYRPGFGWGIGIGNFYGYYGSPYYGRGWGGYGWNDGYYGGYGRYWPGYNTYGYSAYAYPQNDQTVYSQSTESTEDNQNEDQLPPLPTEQELATFTDQQLLSFIAWVAQGFTKELGQFNTGDTWVKYFQLNNLQSLAPQPPRGAAVAQQTQTTNLEKSQGLVGDVLNRMNTAAQDNQYKTIADTWGFKALHAALQEASKPEDVRAVTVLKGQTDLLNKSLERVSTGDGWRKHLQIDSLQQMASDKSIASNDNIDKIATIFDRVAQNPDYRAIVQLPGFEGVYSSLHRLTDGREQQRSAQRTPPPPPEGNETR